MKTFRVTKEVKMTKGLYRVITRSTESFTTEAEIVWNLEKTLHKLYKKYDYKPLQNFGGKTECFKI